MKVARTNRSISPLKLRFVRAAFVETRTNRSISPLKLRFVRAIFVETRTNRRLDWEAAVASSACGPSCGGRNRFVDSRAKRV